MGCGSSSDVRRQAEATAADGAGRFVLNVEAAPLYEQFKGIPASIPASILTPWPPGGKVEGTVAPGWEKVEEAFKDNFAKGLEKSAQLVIVVDGQTVIDVYGSSTAEDNAAFDGNTIMPINSSGKQIEVLVMAMLVDRKLVEYSTKVSEIWPEFGAGGKADITVADVMRHRAGVPWFAKPSSFSPGDSGWQPDKTMDEQKLDFRRLTPEELGVPATVDGVIAETPRVTQKEGDSTHIYHGQTRGLIVDGILRRVDPEGRGIEAFVTSEIFTPLGVEHYRLAVAEDEQDRFNIAIFESPPAPWDDMMVYLPASKGEGEPSAKRAVLDVSLPGNPANASGLGTNVMDPSREPKPDPTHRTVPKNGKQNQSEFYATVMTSQCTLASSRASATIFRDFAEGGGKFCSAETVRQAMAGAIDGLNEPFTGKTCFTQGGLNAFDRSYELDNRMMESKAHAGLHGWTGFGGSLNVLDCDKKVTFMYTPNGCNMAAKGDPRVITICNAYQACIADHLAM